MIYHALRHLLPNGRALRVSANKRITEFFTGLGAAFDDFKIFFDQIWEDLDPAKTRQLDKFESQFALPDAMLTEQERRDRLDATWKAQGGQDPGYLQETLRAAGFDVYVHEWWIDPLVRGRQQGDGLTRPVAKNPATFLRDTSGLPFWVSGANHDSAMCGGDDMYCASSSTPPGYVLVNKDAESYIIDVDAETHRYYLYIGAAAFPMLATVPAARQDEFETLCLRICPTEQWLGILVNYT